MKNASKIVDRLEEVIGIDGAPRRIVLTVEQELHSHFGIARLQAAELSERLEAKVATVIAERQLAAESSGLLAVLALVGASSDTVVGSCFSFPDDEQAVALAKGQRRSVTSLLAGIKALNFSQFERFGARVLILLGANSAKITPHGGDQGIDFYGELNLGRYQDLPIPFMKLSHDIRLLFAGQAKHYPNSSITPGVVRELIGAIELARSKVFSKDGLILFDDLNLKSFSPVVAMLFTTGSVSSGARHLAEAAGIIVRSGEQLAVFLADHGVGMREKDGHRYFDQDAFEDWVGSA